MFLTAILRTVLLFFISMFTYSSFSQIGCSSYQLNNNNPGNAKDRVCFYDSKETLIDCMDCQITGNGWKCGSKFESIKNQYYYATVTSLENGSQTIVGTTCFRDNVLPVELIRFEAKEFDNQVRLIWETASEKDSDFFEILKFDPNTEVKKSIGLKKAAGNSRDLVSYEYIDNQPSNGLNYYMLRQVDFDGKEELFPPISIQVFNNNLIEFYPNPTSDNTIYWNSLHAAIKELGIYSQDGRMIEVITNPAESYTFENKNINCIL